METLVISRQLLLNSDLCAAAWCLCSKVLGCLNWALELSPLSLELEAY